MFVQDPREKILLKMSLKSNLKTHEEGFPGGAVVENLPAGKIPHAAEQLGP